MDFQNFDAFLPVDPDIPDDWESARNDITQNFKQTANVLNTMQIGYYLDLETETGKKYIPSSGTSGSSTEYRQIFRKVVETGALVAATPKSVAHGIPFNSNYTFIAIYGAATNYTTFAGKPLSNNNLDVDGTNVTVTAAANWDTSVVVLEYLKER